MLHTARNQGIVSYKGDELHPRRDGLVIVTLLTENITLMDETTCKRWMVDGFHLSRCLQFPDTFADVRRMSVHRSKRM